MTNKLWAASIALAVFGVAPVSAEPQETSEDEVKTAVRATWDAYIEAFSNARNDVVASDVYAAPSYQLSARGASVRMTAADTKTAFDATHRSLATERYDRSETDTVGICVINTGAALLSAHFTRYRTDNSVLMKSASAYLFGKFSDGWRIVATIGNPAAKLIACDQGEGNHP